MVKLTNTLLTELMTHYVGSSLGFFADKILKRHLLHSTAVKPSLCRWLSITNNLSLERLLKRTAKPQSSSGVNRDQSTEVSV